MGRKLESVICGYCTKAFLARPDFIKRGYAKYCNKECSNKGKVIDAKTRFWEKVEKTDTCWNWTAAKDEDGYGIFDKNSGHGKAHRFSYFLHFGEIPKDMLICHKCDTPQCVNPDHLFLGTKLDNSIDMVKKGRHSKGDITPYEKRKRGENHPNSKLTTMDVLKIREDFKNGLTAYRLSKIHTVNESVIRCIILRKTWNHVA